MTRPRLVALVVAGAAVALPAPAQAQQAQCPATVDASAFASKERLQALLEKMNSFGQLRLAGSPEQEQMLDFLAGELRSVPGIEVRDQPYKITSWEPTTRAVGAPGPDLSRAGQLSLVRNRPFKDKPILTAGAIAYTKPTGARGVTGEVVYLPAGTPITAANAKGKIVLRDQPIGSVPYAAIAAFSTFLTPDLASTLTGNYARPYLSTSDQTDQVAAGKAGAKGIAMAFDVPDKDVRGYWGSHTGTLQRIPGVWVGVDTREQLKRLASQHRRIRIAVRAKITPDKTTRNLIARIPGQSSEKIVLTTNSDANSYVQENGDAVLTAVAQYLGSLPMACRPRTIEIVLSSDHLGFNEDGNYAYLADPANRKDLVFAMAAEHFGTREILPKPRTDGGPGTDLGYSGVAEPYAWFAPNESPALGAALTDAIQRRGDTRAAVLRGLDVPSPGRFPAQCSFGGLANFYHGQNIPAIGGISGPWSMWAGAFGEGAIDFDRYHTQALVVGDTIMAVAAMDKTAIEGSYPVNRAAVHAGAPTCDIAPPAKEAPTA